MLPQALPAGAEQLTVTNSDTATDILTLIRTAASNAGFEFDPRVNHVVLQVDSASDSGIRYSVSMTPTTTKGIEVGVANAVEVNMPPEDIKVVRTTAAKTALLNIEVYRKQPPRP